MVIYLILSLLFIIIIIFQGTFLFIPLYFASKLGGECIDGNNDFDCVCGQGFTGKKCQHEIDYCIEDPCQNGGTCSNTATGYECECRPGYDGLTCGLDIDECINSRCVPQGTAQCNNLDNKYECECRVGFTGEFCETNTDNCASGPCLNGGECKDGEGSYTCSCPRGLFVYIYNFISILGFYFFF